MNLWKVLYIKELKDNRNTFLFLVVATLVLDLYAYARGVVDGKPTPYLILALVPFVAVFIFPFVLLHSFSQEFKGQTHYQLLALPVPRAAVVMAKFLAVFSAGVAVFVLAMGAVHLISLDYTGLTRDRYLYGRFTALQGSAMWWSAGQCYFVSLLLLMGVATAMAGLKLVIKRIQRLGMAAFLVASLYLYGRMLASFIEPLSRLFGRQVPFADSSGATGYLSTMLSIEFFTVLFSLLLLGLGLLLFERFAEA